MWPPGGVVSLLAPKIKNVNTSAGTGVAPGEAGFTMIGAEAGEVMAVVQTAMLAQLPYPKLRDAILAHPTMAEGLGDLFANVPYRSAQ